MSAEEAQRELRARLARERAARSELERVSRLKDEFLATLARELRAPLNAILGWSRLIEHGTLTSEDAQRGGQTITRNVRALAQVVEDLTDASAMLAGKIRVQPEETALVEVVEAALETAQDAAEAKGVMLRKKLPADACLVFGDPHRLQQIIRNLLSNAVKFTPRGGSVTATLAQANGDWEVCITDTGIGLKRELVPVVFERFHQDKAEPTGLGLGLAIVRELVELHGGRAWATSAGEGCGATFHICLPRLAPRERAVDAHAAADPAARIDLEGVRVLVVDDEGATLALCRHTLSEQRAIVVTAATVDAALATLTTFPADVLVCDPSINGREADELLGALRAVREGVPAVALTAFTHPEDAVRARNAGFQMHMAKPLEPEELVRIITQLAGRA